MPKVNILGYRHDDAATRGRDVVLMVDRRALVDVLEEAIPSSSSVRVWSEKADVRVVTRNLKKSAAHPGDYALLTCAHCELPEDIVLKPFTVRHEGDFIVWLATPPGADIYFEGDYSFELRFHRPQYEGVVARVMQRSPDVG